MLLQHNIISMPQNASFVIEVLLPSICAFLGEAFAKDEYFLRLVLQGYSSQEVVRVQQALEWAEVPHEIIRQPWDEDHLRVYWKTRLRGFSSQFPYFLMTDDDFEFKSGSFRSYRLAVEYLEHHPACALVMCASWMGSRGQKGMPGPVPYAGTIWTNRGLVFRNLEKDGPLGAFVHGVCWRPAVQWAPRFGGDWLLAWSPSQFGFHPAKLFGCPTRHYQARPEKIENFPSRIRPYFEWKRQQGPFLALKTEDWRQTPAARFLSRVFALPSNFDVTQRDSILKHIRMAPSFYKTVYRPEALKRFGEDALQEWAHKHFR